MATIVARAKAKDAVDVVDMVDMERAVKAEIATDMDNRVSAPIGKLSAILQMHAENGNTLSSEKTAEQVMSAFSASVGCQTISKSMLSYRNVSGSGRE